jgi:hypothetical protein
MNYTSHQTWTLENNKLHNEYGNCLFGDNITNLVYMNNCNNKSSIGLEWIYDNLGRLQLKNNPDKCLTPIYEGLLQEVKNKQNLNLNNISNVNNNDKFLQIKLSDCDKNINKQWAFY